MKTSPRRISRERAKADILALRESGLTIDQIHATLEARYREEYGRSIARSTVYKYLRQALDDARERNMESAERLRELNTRRLNRLLRAHYPAAIKGHLGATDRVLRVLDQLARLHGLYAPTKHEVDHKGTLEALLAPLLSTPAADEPGSG